MDNNIKNYPNNEPYPLVYKICHDPANVGQVLERIMATSNDDQPTIIIIVYHGTFVMGRKSHDDMIVIYGELQKNYVPYDDSLDSRLLFIKHNTYNDYGYIYYTLGNLCYRFYHQDEKLVQTYLEKCIAQLTESEQMHYLVYNDTYFYDMKVSSDNTTTTISNMLPILVICDSCEIDGCEFPNIPIFQENKYTELYKDENLYIYLLEKRPFITKKARSINNNNTT